MLHLITLALAFAVPVLAVQNPYDQCGGINWTGGTTCTAGWTCQYQNPYYSQCLQASNTPSPVSTTQSPATTVSTAVQTPYGQCGGINWTGGTTCTAGWTCQYQNPYYSQCLQASNTPSPVSTTQSPATTANTAVQTPYGQCGGINWTGGTTCTAGWTCQYQNPYYSQCLQAPSSAASSSSVRAPSSTVSTVKSPSSTTTISSTSSKTSSSLTTTTTPKLSSSSSSSSTSTTPKSSSASTSTSKTSSTSGPNPTYKASITHYGAGDSFGSPNCNTNTAACGFYTYPGYSAAISQNFYGAAPGAGAGPACGTCWRVTGQTDSSGNALSNAGTSIVVMVNNLCPADGNPLCAQNGMSGTNMYGANVNFDLCSDSGAQQAFFGNDGVGLAIGTATQVDCSMWSGTVVH